MSKSITCRMWGRRGAIALSASRYNLISSHYTTRNIWSLQLLESQTKSCISFCPWNIFIVFFAAKTTVSDELNMSRMAGYTCGYIWGKTNWPVVTTRNSSYICIWSGDLWSSKFSTLSVFNVPKVLIFPTPNQCTPQNRNDNSRCNNHCFLEPETTAPQQYWRWRKQRISWRS
jgi:hypothetical protein